MGCGSTAVKTSAFVFNFILVIVGIAGIVWLSVTGLANYENVIVMLYVGYSLLALLAFVGCIAVFRESVCLAALCSLGLLLLAILHTVIIFSIPDIKNYALTVVNEAWDHGEMSPLENAHKCCGKESANDYIVLSQAIPSSCYANEQDVGTSKFYQEGCISKLQSTSDLFDQMNFGPAAFINLVVLIALEIVGFFLALFLVINLRNKQRRLQF